MRSAPIALSIALSIALAVSPAVSRADPAPAGGATTLEEATELPNALRRIQRLTREHLILARLASHEGSAPEVKLLAERIEREQRDAGQRAEAMVRRLGREDATGRAPERLPESEVEARLLRDTRRALTELEGLRGEAFDRRYLQTVILTSDRSLAVLSELERGLESEALRPLAAELLPALRRQRTLARHLLVRLDGD